MIKELKFNCKRIEISINLLFFAVFLTMLAAGYIVEFSIIFASIFLHEAGHFSVALLFGKKVKAVRILPVGLNAELDENEDGVWSWAFVYFAGPAVNILLTLTCCLAKTHLPTKPVIMYFIILMNIYLSIFNMIPVLPMDGGNLLKCILINRVGFFSASNYTRRISRILSFILILLGAVQLVYSRYNFSLLLIGIYISFNLKSEEMGAAFMNMKHVVYRRTRFLKKGIYPARDLVVVKSVQIGEILKHVDFDRFHIVYVLDDHLKIERIFTEQEIIDGMLKYNAEMTFDEFMKQV